MTTKNIGFGHIPKPQINLPTQHCELLSEVQRADSFTDTADGSALSIPWSD